MSKFFIAAAMAVVALFSSASSVDAGFIIVLHETGFADQTINITSGQNNDVPSQVFGDYTVNFSAFDSAPGQSILFGGALVSQNTFSISTNGVTAGADLQITVQDNTFTSTGYLPGTSVTVQNSLSTTAISNGSITAHGFMTSTGTVATTNITLAGPTLSGSVANSATGSVAPFVGNVFTLGNISTIHFTGGVGAANYTVTTLAVAAPAPPAVLMVLTGLPVLGIGGWIRRRRQLV